MQSNSRFQRWAGRLAQACACATCAVGLVVSLAWILGGGTFKLPFIKVPVAPSTAWLMVLLGTGLFLQTRWSKRPALHWFYHGLMGLTLVTAGLVLLAHARNWELPFEAWMVANAGVMAALKTGRMAVPAALLFTLGTFGLWLEATGSAWWPWARRAATVCGFSVVVAGAVFALTSLAGVAELYPVGRWRVAPLTSALFVAWGTGLLGATLADGSVLRWMAGETQAEGAFHLRRFDRVLLASCAALLVGLTVGGVSYLRQKIMEARADVQEDLRAIADLKLDQITSWRSERLSDARFFHQAEFVRRDVEACLADPASAKARADVLQWLTLLKGGTRYRWVALFDANARLLLSVPREGESYDSQTRQRITATLAAAEPQMDDLASFGSNDLHMDVLFPIPAVNKGGVSGAKPPVAAVLLRLSPHDVLFPLLKKWPMASGTAETVLVRRQQDQAVLLNELRHATSRPLTRTFPLVRTNLPAVRAAQGFSGSFEGVDYRGKAVLAELRVVSNSPWRMVVKEDTEEIYAGARQRAWSVVGLFAALGLLLLAITGLVWQQRNTELLHQRLIARREQALSERLSHFMNLVNDVILLSDSQGRIVDANPRASEVYGHSLEELRHMPLSALLAPEVGDELDADGHPHEKETARLFQTVHCRKDSSRFPVEISRRRVEIGGEFFWLGVLRDITQRQEAEAERERLIGILERTPDFVGVVDLQGRVLYLNATLRRLAGLPTEAEGRLRTLADFLPAWAAERVSQEGLPSAKRDGTWIGETALRSVSGHEFPVSQVILAHKDARGEVTHFSSIMRDLSERKRMEQILRTNEERLRTIIEHSTQLHYSHTPDHLLTYVSPQSREFLDCEPGEALVRLTDFLSNHPANAGGVETTETAIRTGQRQPPFELELISRKGRKLWVEVNESPVVLKGRTVAVVGSLTDITQRKRSEQVIQRLAQLSRDLGAASEANQAAQALADAALELLGWDACFLKVRSADMKHAQFMLSMDTINGQRVHVPPGAGDEVTRTEQRLLSEGGLLILREPQTTEMFVPFGNTDQPSRSLLYVPLRHHGRYLGLFSIQSYQPQAYDRAALDLLQTLADHVAGALERLRAEATLRETERRLSTLVANLPAGFAYRCRNDRDWTMDLVTAGAQNLLGVAPEELTSGQVTYNSLVHPDDQQRVWDEVQAALTLQQPYQLEYRLLPRQGAEKWVWEQGRGVFNDRGEVQGLEGLIADITARKHAEAATHELSGRLLAAQDEERRRIARELHDTTAQTIAALCVNLTMLESRIPASNREARRVLTDAAALGERAGQEIRTLSYLLHPPILEHVGLAGAIREYAAGFTRRSGVQARVEIGANLGRFAPEVELALLRIVQESLVNVHRHSGSPTAVIRLRLQRDVVVLDVADVGKGLRAELLAGDEEGRLGVGIPGMRERLRHLGGHLELKSSNAGTIIRAVLPLHRGAQLDKN